MTTTKVFENLSSTELTTRLDDLRAQLAAGEIAVEERQGALETALAEGKSSDKALADLAAARGKAEALRSVIGSAETALSTALAREERAARRAALKGLQDRMSTTASALEKKIATIAEAAGRLDKAAADFDASGNDLRAILGEAGVGSVSGLIPSGSAFVHDNGLNSASSNLNSALTRARQEIGHAIAALEREEA
jgi:chromosome segregation ATPase